MEGLQKMIEGMNASKFKLSDAQIKEINTRVKAPRAPPFYDLG